MKVSSLTLRSLAVAVSLVAVGTSAQALTIAANGLMANSVQAFSQEAQDAFDAGKVTVTPLGNATSVGVEGAPGAYSFPITSITIGSKLNIAAGDAKGSALEIARVDRKLGKLAMVVANFTINYGTKQVMADTTPMGAATPAGTATVRQAPLYNFHVATPLGLKYKFPLSITGHEVLDQLTSTPEANLAMKKALALDVVLRAALDGITTFGTLTQDIAVTKRTPAASTIPYTP